MKKQNAPGRGGVKHNWSATENVFDFSHCSTSRPAIQPHYAHLLAQAEQKMNRAELVGDDHTWVRHFQIWVALLAASRGVGGDG